MGGSVSRRGDQRQELTAIVTVDTYIVHVVDQLLEAVTDLAVHVVRIGTAGQPRETGGQMGAILAQLSWTTELVWAT
jgi:hypothetical protein